MEEPFEESFSITTLDPVGDIQRVVDRGNTSQVMAALHELVNVINQLVSESHGNQMYPKALACVKELRHVAIKVNMPQIYNQYLLDFKASGNHGEFWQQLQQNQISLIHSGESENSEVSPGESSSVILYLISSWKVARPHCQLSKTTCLSTLTRSRLNIIHIYPHSYIKTKQLFYVLRPTIL